MSRKSYLLAGAAVLASALVLTVAVPHGRSGMVHAEDKARSSDVADRAPTLTGRLVRVEAADAASCERTQPVTVDANALNVMIEGQLAHLTRLAAEYRGSDEITVPPELQSHQNDAVFAAALRDEGVAFAERKEALASQIAGLNQAKELEQREVEFTRAKEVAFARQNALLQKELANINGLMDKGLAVTSQRLNLEQSVLQSETNLLDLKLLILKAQQEVSRIDRVITDLRNQRRNEVVAEFKKTQQDLGASQQALAAAAANIRSPARAECDDSKEFLYVIARGPAGLFQAFPVAPVKRSPG